jgi:hypothetical protein
MPLELLENNSRTSQIPDIARKSPMPSAPLVSLMTQLPHFALKDHAIGMLDLAISSRVGDCRSVHMDVVMVVEVQ